MFLFLCGLLKEKSCEISEEAAQASLISARSAEAAQTGESG